MSKKQLLPDEIKQIQNLRQTGLTLTEIQKITKKGYGTIFKYIKNVEILPEYKDIWKIKRGGSKQKAKNEWGVATVEAKKIINTFNKKERMIVLACLYWGEGNKTELSLINSDPLLVKVFVECLRDLGVKDCDFSISLRLYEDLDDRRAIIFWEDVLGLPKYTIKKINYLVGKKKGKLSYGMCRVRVKKSAKYFKLIISMINLIKQSF